MRLGDAMNTYNPALNIIKSMGYELRVTPGVGDPADSFHDWVAEKGEFSAYARDPLALLGLVVIFEKRGKQWRRDDDQDLSMEAFSVLYSGKSETGKGGHDSNA